MYRPSVGIALFNNKGHVFIGQRLDNAAEAWQLPQGGIDPGESPETAMWRELAEETGLKTAHFLQQLPGIFRYDLPPDLAPIFWGGRYKGQEQVWFALRHDGDDNAINIHTVEPEFRAWRWAMLNELPSLIVPFKRPLYNALIPELEKIWVNHGTSW
jgi:putative (di)nucleoside polyphosphate hydrolase